MWGRSEGGATPYPLASAGFRNAVLLPNLDPELGCEKPGTGLWEVSGGPQSGVVGEKREEMGGDIEAIKDKSGKPRSLLVSAEGAEAPCRGQNNRGASIQMRSTETLTENLRADRGGDSRAHSQR